MAGVSCWVAYDAPGCLGLITTRTAEAGDVALRDRLQSEEDARTAEEGREPRAVRVWPTRPDDVYRRKDFGLPSDNPTRKTVERQVETLRAEGRLLPPSGMRRSWVRLATQTPILSLRTDGGELGRGHPRQCVQYLDANEDRGDLQWWHMGHQVAGATDGVPIEQAVRRAAAGEYGLQIWYLVPV